MRQQVVATPWHPHQTEQHWFAGLVGLGAKSANPKARINGFTQVAGEPLLSNVRLSDYPCPC